MKIVVASDKWRGSFTSAAAGEAIAVGIRRALPDADVRVVPLADGGEGTLDVVLTTTDAEIFEPEVTGPLGEAITTSWARLAAPGHASRTVAASSSRPGSSACR